MHGSGSRADRSRPGPAELEVAQAAGALTFAVMLPLLNQPGFQKRALPLSVAAWHGMIRDNLAPARSELIRGVIVEKMSKSILHTVIADHIAEIFKDALRNTHWVRIEAPLTLTDSEPEPDISVVPGARQQFKTHPTTAVLAVEVSVKTLAEDRAMAEIYSEAGVEEYWVVNVPDRSIEVHRQPHGEAYSWRETFRCGQALTCATLPVTLDVGSLFAELPESAS